MSRKMVLGLTLLAAMLLSLPSQGQSQSRSFADSKEMMEGRVLKSMKRINAARPAQTLPYSNSLATAEAFAEFEVLDANEDETTWTFHAGYGDTRCASNWYRTGDDWLVSPAVKFEAGKRYRFALDAKTSYGSGRFEVKMASGEVEAVVLSEGATVVPATDVAMTDFTTYENGEVSVVETGYYHIGIHAISNSGYDNLIVANFLVEAGPDASAPAAAEALSVTPLEHELGATVTFTVPTKTIGGAALAAGDVVKMEVLRDGAVVKTFEAPAPGTQLTHVDHAEDLTIGNHKYQIVSYGATGIGGKTHEVVVFLSAVLTVPAWFDLTKQDVYGTFQTIDANNDNFGVWDWDSSTGAYYYGNNHAADDYLVSTGIQMEAGKNYVVTVTANCHSSNFPERFEVKLGQEATVAGLNLTAMKATMVVNESFDDYESEFTVPESGVYYMAVHAISDPDMWRLNVRKLAVSKGPDGNAPAAPTLVVEAGAEGADHATVVVTAPKTTLHGTNLSGTLAKLEVLRDGEVIKTFEGVAPGTVETFSDLGLTTGNHTYQAVPYDADGAGQKSERVTVYVGEDEVSNVENMQIVAETATSLTFTWDDVLGAHSGYVNTADVEYDVEELELVKSEWFSYYNETTLATVTGKTTATVDYPVDEGEQDYKYFGVKARNGLNESNATVNVLAAIMGAPYGLPMEETFANGMNYSWFGNANAGVNHSGDGSGDDDALMLFASTQAGHVALESGKLDIRQAATPTLMFDAKKGSSTVDRITVYGITPDGKTTDIETVVLTDDYMTYAIPVPESMAKERWIRLGFGVDFEATEVFVLLDNVRVFDYYPCDLSVQVTAPATLTLGGKAAVKATVKNESTTAVSGYVVVVKTGEKVLLNTTVNEVLLPFDTAPEITASLETSVFDEPGEVVVTATVVCFGDGNAGNDTAETVVWTKEPSVPGVANVAAEADARMVVSWQAPASDVALAARVTEDFESDEGGWQFVDADNDGFNWGYYYGSNVAGSIAHSGSGIVYSESYVNGIGGLMPDNWLVSPKAGLGGTFRFWAFGQDPEWAEEHFQVYASTKSATDVSTFEPVSEEFVATGEYMEYAVDLTSYAGASGWIAIRHFNVTDMYRLIVDDVTYHLGIEKYNVYVDGRLAASVAANETSATIENVAAGQHVVAVSVVYANGMESKPVFAGSTSGLKQTTVTRNPVDVYSADGRLVRKQATTLDGLKGVYIVNGEKVVLK